jgi:hypothetical protein
MNTIIGFPKPQVACSIHAGGTPYAALTEVLTNLWAFSECSSLFVSIQLSGIDEVRW